MSQYRVRYDYRFDAPRQLENYPMPTSRPRIVVIGAGMAGILAGIKLLEAGLDNFTIYEKADRVGGTWRDNTYPGLSCDTPSHHYTYTFARNPGWSSYLPPGPEIQAYFEATCDQYDVRRHIRFNEEVESAEFRDGQWQLVMKGGRRDSAHIVIAATGVLHHPSTPHIPGMETFQGTLFHSAHWDHSVALDNRRVGVIGMGSTGVQIISALAGRAALVEHYVRTPQWIMPVQNTPYSEAQRDAFKRDPEALAREMGTEEYLANVNSYTQVITQEDKEAIAYWRETCYRNLEDSVADPALREQLRPDHEVLCKRLIFSPDYYEAIQRPGAALVREDIQAIEANGIRTVD
ncbi:MAG: flavin-containing monooxygenase, partial [Halioglobus sp.]